LLLTIVVFVQKWLSFKALNVLIKHGWQHHIGENWHNRATTSGGEYSITTEDGCMRLKHVLIEFKK
jgi:hypothetical protein